MLICWFVASEAVALCVYFPFKLWFHICAHNNDFKYAHKTHIVHSVFIIHAYEFGEIHLFLWSRFKNNNHFRFCEFDKKFMKFRKDEKLLTSLAQYEVCIQSESRINVCIMPWKMKKRNRKHSSGCAFEMILNLPHSHSSSTSNGNVMQNHSIGKNTWNWKFEYICAWLAIKQWNVLSPESHFVYHTGKYRATKKRVPRGFVFG